MVGVLVLLQLVAGMGEHALVLRRAHALRTAQNEGWRAAVLRSGFRFLLLGGGLRSGQNRRRGLCGIHGFTAADHLEC